MFTIACNISGPSIFYEWAIEGKRLIPLLQRVEPKTRFSSLANICANIQTAKDRELPEPAKTRTLIRKISDKPATNQSNKKIKLDNTESSNDIEEKPELPTAPVISKLRPKKSTNSPKFKKLTKKGKIIKNKLKAKRKNQKLNVKQTSLIADGKCSKEEIGSKVTTDSSTKVALANSVPQSGSRRRSTYSSYNSTSQSNKNASKDQQKASVATRTNGIKNGRNQVPASDVEMNNDSAMMIETTVDSISHHPNEENGEFNFTVMKPSITYSTKPKSSEHFANNKTIQSSNDNCEDFVDDFDVIIKLGEELVRQVVEEQSSLEQSEDFQLHSTDL